MSRLLLFLLACLVALSGCSTTKAKTDAAPASSAVPGSNEITDNDIAYMAKVERYATLRGIDLVWVHPPRAKRTKD